MSAKSSGDTAITRAAATATTNVINKNEKWLNGKIKFEKKKYNKTVEIKTRKTMPKRGIMHEKQQQQPKNLPKRDEIRDETKSIKTLIPNKYIYTYFQYSTNILFSKFQCEH